jgi:hypothetical protein
MPQQRAIAHRINLVSRRELQDLRRITPPRTDRAQLGAIFDKLSHALRLSDLSTRVIASDVGAAKRAAVRGAAELLDVNERLAAVGLTACAE